MPGAFALRRLGPRSVFPILGVTDFSINTISAVEADVSWTPVSGAVSTQIKYRQVGSGAWGEWQDFDDDLTVTLSDATNYEFQLRELNVSDKCGPRSNTVTYETIAPSVSIKDVKTKTIQETTAGTPSDLDLSAMDGGALNFAAGDKVLIFAGYGHGAVASAQGTQGAATGWSELYFENQAVGVVQHVIRGLEKTMVGGETTVDVFDDANAVTVTSRRANYIAVVLTPGSGSSIVFENAAQHTTTGGNPSPQIVTVGGLHVAVAWAVAFASAATAASAFSTFGAAAPYLEVRKDTTGGTAPVANMLLRLKLFPNGELPADFSVDMADLGNNGLASGWHRVIV